MKPARKFAHMSRRFYRPEQSHCPVMRERAVMDEVQPDSPNLRAMLGEIAWAIARTRDNYLSAFYHRVARRRGKQKAIMALAHKVLVILYHVLREKKPYADLGADYFEKLDTSRIQRHHVRRLEPLGYVVTLTPKEVA